MNNKIGIAAIILATAAISFTAISFWLPSQMDAQNETAMQQFTHPCQSAALGNYFLYKNDYNLQNKPGVTQADLDEFHQFVLEKELEYQNTFLANECPTTQEIWMTPEFDSVMNRLLDEGF